MSLIGSWGSSVAARRQAVLLSPAGGWVRGLSLLTRTAPIRPTRVVALVATLLVLNFLDLGYTLTESQRRSFVELNPVASGLLAGSPMLLVAYKATLSAVGCVILLSLRRSLAAELAAWLMVAVYVNLMSRWATYYEHLMIALSDPAVNVCPLHGITY